MRLQRSETTEARRVLRLQKGPSVNKASLKWRTKKNPVSYLFSVFAQGVHSWALSALAWTPLQWKWWVIKMAPPQKMVTPGLRYRDSDRQPGISKRCVEINL